MIYIGLFALSGKVFSANQWRGGTGEETLLGTSNVSDIDTNSFQKVIDPVDRLVSNYREGLAITYASASSLSVAAGEVTVSNSAGTIRLFVKTTTATTVTFSDIDTGAEASSTTYYVYAIAASASTDTATFKISTSSSAPTGVTYYKKLGSFTNNSSSDIAKSSVSNDNDFNYAAYDSGWFAVSTATTYTKTHGLGTTNVLTTLYFSESSDGSNMAILGGGPDSNSGTEGQINVSSLSTTSIGIRTSSGTYIVDIKDGSGTTRQLSSGYARIIMLSLD